MTIYLTVQMNSFGVLFPPIAIVECIAILIETSLQQVLVVDLIQRCNNQLASQNNPEISESVQMFKVQTEESCNRFPHTFMQTIQTVVVYVGIVWGIFLWDIIGDDIGLLPSMWSFLIMAITGILLRYRNVIREHFFRRESKPSENMDLELPEVESSSEIKRDGDISSVVVVDNPLVQDVESRN